MKCRRRAVAVLCLLAPALFMAGCGDPNADTAAPEPPAHNAEPAPVGMGPAQPDQTPDVPAQPVAQVEEVAKAPTRPDDALPEQIVYVAPTGTDTAAGTEADPLSLKGVCAKKDLAPGTHVLLRGGTYRMERPVEVVWKAEPERRIVLRSAPGEWAVLDGGILVTGGATHVTLRDFEITRTKDVNTLDPNWWSLSERTRPSYGGKGANLKFKMGGQLIQVLASEGVHLINLYAHDNVSGGCFGLWNPALNVLTYGNLMIRNGWDDRGRGHGHGAYIQNGWPEDRFGKSKKVFKHNISALNYSTGAKSYGSSPCIVSTHFFECIHYGAGLLSWTNGSANYLAGSGKNYMDDIVLTGNVFYQPDRVTGDVGGTVYLGWGNRQKRTCVFADNTVLGGGSEAVRAQYWQSLTFTGNTIYDDKRLFRSTPGDGGTGGWTWNRNTYYAPAGVEKPIAGAQGDVTFDEWKQQTGLDADSVLQPGPPTAVGVKIFPNEYDANRAHAALMNWGKSATPSVDLGAFLNAGDRFVVYDALDFRGDPVAQGEFAGAPVALALKDNPVGREFHALVILRVTPEMKEQYALIEISGKVLDAYRRGDVAAALGHLEGAGLADSRMARRIHLVQKLDAEISAAREANDVPAQCRAVIALLAAEADATNVFRVKAEALAASFGKKADASLARAGAAKQAGDLTATALAYQLALAYRPGDPKAVAGMAAIEKDAVKQLNLALNFRRNRPEKAKAILHELITLFPAGNRLHDRAKEALEGMR